MKRKTTKEILTESFRELAGRHQVDKITIKQITENCGYSPATFYRHFKDKYDLIAWDYVHRTNRIMDKVGIDGYQWKDTLLDGIKFFQTNREYMQNLLRNTNGYDAFLYRLSEANISHLTSCILKLTGKKELENDIGILVRIYCYGTVNLVCQWLMGEITVEDNQIAAFLEQALPKKLYEILCIQ